MPVVTTPDIPKETKVDSVVKPSTPPVKHVNVVSAPSEYSSKRIEKVSEMPKDFMPGSLSIKEEISKKVDESELVESLNKESEEFKNTPAIQKEALAKAWDLLMKTLSTEPDLRSTLVASVPAIKDDFVLEVQVKNQIQKGKVETYRHELVPFLRDKLHNKFIRIEVIVNYEKPAEVKPVSPTEKFNHFAAKNSAMFDLQKKFGLEPNY